MYDFDPTTLTVISSSSSSAGTIAEATTAPGTARGTAPAVGGNVVETLEDDDPASKSVRLAVPCDQVYGTDYRSLRILDSVPCGDRVAGRLAEDVPVKMPDASGGFGTAATATISAPATPAGSVAVGEPGNPGPPEDSPATHSAVARSTDANGSSSSSSSSTSISAASKASAPYPSATEIGFSSIELNAKWIPPVCYYCHALESVCVCAMLPKSGKFVTDPDEHNVWYPPGL